MSSLADFLAAHRPAIVERYARLRGPSASALRGELPDILGALERSLRAVEAPSGDPAPPGSGLPEARAGVDLADVVRDYGTLRDSIYELLEEAGMTPTMRELRVLARGLSTGILAQALRPDERRRREALAGQLRASEEQLRLIVDSIPLLISFVTSDERYGLVNKAYEDWFGLPPEALLGRALREVVGEEAYAVLGPHVRRALSGEHLTVELHGVPYHHGGGRDVKIIFVPRRDGAGAVTGYVALLDDITAQRQAERDRERLLERESAARQQAEEASRLRDEFLATVSHELRTPLTSVLGWVQMLRAGGLAEAQQVRAHETIERNARAQAQLIDDLLDMSRILSGQLRLEVEPLDVASVVAAALETVRPAADARGVRLQATLGSGGLVMGDVGRLQQVVWNLLTNAVKFTPRDGRVRVTVACLDSAVEVVVSDTGQGIEPEFLPHVFERFRQAEGGTTRRHGGLGLGLSIVRQLVELHGGAVRAASDGPGRGASFTVRLPLSVTRHHDSPVSSPPAAAPSASSLHGLRLLVVDDEEDTRELLGFLLEAQGASVRLAASAAEARARFDDEVPDVLVSDIGMPRENGYALIESIRRRPREQGGDVPAVALTAYARTEDRMRALTAGFSNHVAKPAEPDELFAVIASLARYARLRRA